MRLEGAGLKGKNEEKVRVDRRASWRLARASRKETHAMVIMERRGIWGNSGRTGEYFQSSGTQSITYFFIAPRKSQYRLCHISSNLRPLPIRYNQWQGTALFYVPAKR